MPKLKIAGRACLALLFFSLLYAPAAKAEDSSKDVQFIPRILTVNDGLPPGVESIAQTQDGYMWFATQDGVARFDGAQFRIFDKNNTPGINRTT
jgi:ligand-binding sensor domain-containing protein